MRCDGKVVRWRSLRRPLIHDSVCARFRQVLLARQLVSTCLLARNFPIDDDADAIRRVLEGGTVVYGQVRIFSNVQATDSILNAQEFGCIKGQALKCFFEA